MKSLICIFVLFSSLLQSYQDCLSRSSFNSGVCIIVASSKTVKCWGTNYYGQLGLEDELNRGDDPNEMSDYLPDVSLNGTNVISIHVGGEHSCAKLLPDLDVQCWGRNHFGQLGYGDKTNRGNATFEMGSYLPFVNFGPEVIAAEIYIGGYHNMVLSDIGEVKVWGYGQFGQLGYGDTSNKGDSPNQLGSYLPYVNVGTGSSVQKIIATSYSSCALLDDLSMKCWGQNNVGQLGLGDIIPRGDSSNQLGDYLPPINFPSGIVIDSFGSGHHHVGIITNFGYLYTWGWNTNGQLGVGHTNNVGNLTNEMGEYLKKVNLGFGKKVVQMNAATFHTCVILDTYEMKCFGLNAQGQLGYEDTVQRGDEIFEMGLYLPTINLGTGKTASFLHLGFKHSCVVLNDDSIKCWGQNDQGQLGQGNVITLGDTGNELGNYLDPVDFGVGLTAANCFDYSPTLFPSLSLSPSFDPTFVPTSYSHPSFCSSRLSIRIHVCVLTSPTNQVKCFGANDDGNLGYGDISYRGDGINEMGNNLSYVELSESVLSIHVGADLSCALLTSLSIKCWGKNTNGEVFFITFFFLI